ncbi:MAG: hypothetical protein FJY66_01850 [Calditrichaeota bacterium]|nr:hypothetical protein [Calditrichota bacterium]
MNPIIFCLGLLIQVPQDYPTITGAIEASHAGDTVLVHPGTYPEQLWLPAHDILLVSDFYFTGDSSALYSTVIDASAWAEEDTASAVMIVNGCTRATVLSGLTVTGGHGTVNEALHRRQGGAFLISNSSPIISSNILRENWSDWAVALNADFSDLVFSENLIYDNWLYLGGTLGLLSCGEDTPAVIEGNDFGPYFPADPDFLPSHPGISFAYSNAIVRGNRFHDYEGCMSTGVSFSNSRGEVSGNIFKNLHYSGCWGIESIGDVVWGTARMSISLTMFSGIAQCVQKAA